MIIRELSRHATVHCGPFGSLELGERWPSLLAPPLLQALTLVWFDLLPECTRVSWCEAAPASLIRRDIEDREAIYIMVTGQLWLGAELLGAKRTRAGKVEGGQARYRPCDVEPERQPEPPRPSIPPARHRA